MPASTQTAVARLIQGITDARNIAPGDRVAVKPHLIVLGARDALAVLKAFRIAGGERVADPARILLFSDDNLPAPDAATAMRRKQLHEAARQAGIERIVPLAGCEVPHLLEESLIVPGECAVSHLSEIASLGGIGALGLRATLRDMVALLAGKPLLLTVPRAVRVAIRGIAPMFAHGEDLLLAMRRELGRERLSGSALEISSPGMSIDARMAMARNAAHAGLFAAFCLPDRKVVQQLNQRVARKYIAVEANRDAIYAHSSTLDVSQEQPCVIMPGGVRSRTVGEAGGEPIKQAVVRGGIEELRKVTELLKGRKLAAQLAVSPDSRATYEAALREDLLTFLLEAGATIHPPGTPLNQMLHGEVPAVVTDIAAPRNAWRASATTAATAAWQGALGHPEKLHTKPINERKRH